MIIPSDEAENAKRTEAQAASKVEDIPVDDPPPSYSAPSQPVTQTSTAPAPPVIKPSNYVSISRNNGSVKDRWVLDTGLVIPTSLLSPLPTGETEESRRNFSVESKNGEIVADITFAQHNPSGDAKTLSRKRATLYAKSSNGAITTKLHAPHSPRLPFYLNIYASNGSVNIHLPRSFHGLLVIKTWNGSAKFSAEASTELTTFSDVNKTRRSFIGDFSEWSDDEPWAGDEVAVETRNGSVKVQFDNEVHDTAKSKGFFGRLFGL